MGQQPSLELAVRFIVHHETKCGVHVDLQPDPLMATILIMVCRGCGTAMRVNAELADHREASFGYVRDLHKRAS
jgi:hypothetical protein